jgi:hypothetical protein
MATAPPGAAGSIDFGRTFTFVTEDPDWITKILVGGLFTLLSAILVGIPFVLGYWARTVKNVAAGQARPLPAWDDLGGIFTEGLRLLGVYVVYGLGLTLAVGLVGGVVMIPLFAMGSAHRGEGAAAALGGMGVLLLYAVILLVSLLALVFLPAALLRSTLRESFAEGFAVREIVAFIQANLGHYALALVIYLLASFLSQFGMILCCVGVFPAGFWSYLVLGYGLGETVRLNPGSLA